jgi:hypothetical protein
VVTKAQLIQAMGNLPDVSEVMLVKKQYVPDIIRGIPQKFKDCRPYYDEIAVFFDAEESDQIAENIFNFLKSQMTYVEEDEDRQVISTPKRMLQRGTVDCKGYALFTAGVIDSLNRQTGADIPWCFRFVPSKILGTSIGHVFVVLYPGGDEIWVDAVLDRFNEKPFYLVQKDVTVKGSEKVSGLQVGPRGVMRRTMGSAEQSILDMLNEYTLGMIDAVNTTISTSVFNVIAQGVLQTAGAFVPGVSIALGILKAASSLVSSAFGPGSKAALLMADISNNILTAPVTIVETILNGRTYESDQYWGATYYYYYVNGQNKYKNSPSQVADTAVAPALKWFIDRLGVFISGREHIEALVQGASSYLALYSVNAYTTQDIGKVNAAVAVAQQYFNFNGAAGSWANTVGVFDPALVEVANELNESVEQANAQVASGQLVIPGVVPEGSNYEPGAALTWQQKVQQIYQNPWAWVISAVITTGIVLLIVDDE